MEVDIEYPGDPKKRDPQTYQIADTSQIKVWGYKHPADQPVDHRTEIYISVTDFRERTATVRLNAEEFRFILTQVINKGLFAGPGRQEMVAAYEAVTACLNAFNIPLPTRVEVGSSGN